MDNASEAEWQSIAPRTFTQLKSAPGLQIYIDSDTLTNLAVRAVPVVGEDGRQYVQPEVRGTRNSGGHLPPDLNSGAAEIDWPQG